MFIFSIVYRYTVFRKNIRYQEQFRANCLKCLTKFSFLILYKYKVTVTLQAIRVVILTSSDLISCYTA